MKDSLIASAHHYYLLFLNAGGISGLSNITDLFTDKIVTEEINYKNRKYIHLQVLIQRRYGSEARLAENKVERKGDVYYWYDMYIGRIDALGKKIYFIAYPYYKMREYLQNMFNNIRLVPNYHKAQLDVVMNYFKYGDKSIANDSKNLFKAEIIKYSAEIKDSDNANKVNLIGTDPLNSKVFDILTAQVGVLTIKTSALKLRCQKSDIGSIDISFDRLGNYRFWIRYDGVSVAMPLIPIAFSFFANIKALKEDEYISNQTLLEDE